MTTPTDLKEAGENFNATIDRIVEVCIRWLREGPYGEWSEQESALWPFCNAITEAVRLVDAAPQVVVSWLSEAGREIALLEDADDYAVRLIARNPFEPASVFHDIVFACFVAEALSVRLDELSREDADTDDKDGDA